MSYDAHGALEELERPSLTVPRGRVGRAFSRLLNLIPGVSRDVERKTYTGRLLSHREFEEFREPFVAMAEGELAEDQVEAFLKQYLNAVGIPWDVVFDLPPAVMEDAIADFFGCQMQAIPTHLRGSENGGTPTPSGISTPTGTRTATEATEG